MYTPWCDENGKVIDDGTVQRLSENKYRITSAEPNLDWINHIATGMNVNILDDSETTAALALQGPNSREILNSLKKLILKRSQHSAFHPNATQFTLQLGPEMFGVWRQNKKRTQSIFVINNLQPKIIQINLSEII